MYIEETSLDVTGLVAVKDRLFRKVVVRIIAEDMGRPLELERRRRVLKQDLECIGRQAPGIEEHDAFKCRGWSGYVDRCPHQGVAVQPRPLIWRAQTEVDGIRVPVGPA